MKKVLVCCGSGVATSVQTVEKLKEQLDDAGITNVEVYEKPMLAAVPEVESNDDILVYIGMAKADAELQELLDNKNILSLQGLPWLTGMGLDEAFEQVVAKLNE